MIITDSDKERFWNKVDKSGDCWLWTASVSKGYGQFQMRNRPVGAHRVAWMIDNGPIPKDMCVCHHCDNPICVNAAHMFLGTNVENTQDKVNKGRQFSHLKEADAIEIRKRAEAGEKRADLAKEFGVSVVNIGQIIGGRLWKLSYTGNYKPRDSTRGSRHFRSKFTEEQVLEIRSQKGLTHLEIAQKFGVSASAVGHVIRRKTWTHI